MRRGLFGLLGLAVLLAGPGWVPAMEAKHPPAPSPEREPGAAHESAAPAPRGGDAAHAEGAAARGAESHGGAAAGGHGGGHAMPVWTFFFIQLAGFGLLVLVAGKYVWPAVRKGLDARRESIAEAFRAAESDEREAQRQLTELQDKLRAFAMEAKRRRDEAVRQGRMMRLQIEEEARLQARQMSEKAQQEGSLMQARARAEVRKEVLMRAFDESSALLRRQVDDRGQAALVDRFISDVDAMPVSS